MPRVVSAGHVNWDVTLRVDRLPDRDGEAAVHRETSAGGGSAANVATTLAGLDVAVSLLGSVGDDSRGRTVRTELDAAGVDCEHLLEVADAPTTAKYLVVDRTGDTMLLGHQGANEAFEAADLPAAALTSSDHLHLTGQNPETAARLARRAHAAGVTLSFDPGRRIGDRDFGEALSLADVVFLNEREAAVAPDLVDADADAGGRAVALKHGRDGATLRVGGETYTHPGFGVDAVDTAGAGDAFAAGLLAARLGGAGWERTLAVANACGAVAARTAGARTSLTWNDVEEQVG